MLFPANLLPNSPPLDTKKALILLDFQNDFVSHDGKLSVENVRGFLPNLTTLVKEFRTKGDVIWAGTEYRQSRSTRSAVTGSHSILLKQFLQGQDNDDEEGVHYNDPIYTRSPAEAPLSPTKTPDRWHDREAFLTPTMTMTRHRCCLPGSTGIRYPKAIESTMDPQKDLIMLKSHYSAFVDTQLLMHLRTRLITQIYVCGSLSNISVYATVLDAVCHGLEVTIIEDCLGYRDEMCHTEAVRQMADSMGANGIDCQELRDDIAGLLGDVIKEEDFTTKFQVSLPRPTCRTKSHTSKSQIRNWISNVESDEFITPPPEMERKSSKRIGNIGDSKRDNDSKGDSLKISPHATSSEQSPPRKRSTSDVDSLEENRSCKLSHKPSTRRSSENSRNSEMAKQKQKPSARKRWPSQDTFQQPPKHSMTSVTEHVLPTMADIADKNPSLDTKKNEEHNAFSKLYSEHHPCGQKKKNKSVPNIVGQGDRIGNGDCQLCIDVIESEEAENAFYALRDQVQWNKMYHRSGEVPRLVAVQGEISGNGSKSPIYRHPADESPELLPFDSTVGMLKRAAERAAGHSFNHCLIQWYRNSEDNISEHSDKTLDIVRGSSIVNFSLGAQRTMILRMKKTAIRTEGGHREDDHSRPSQRIHLAHNSLFILGEETNQYWLHSIRADKRPATEKDAAERAFEGQRISLTFRQIGTFIDSKESTIWGQGARGKKEKDARKLLKGVEAEAEGEVMIRAFGQENHASADWNWDEVYGKGFDVVNFGVKTDATVPVDPETAHAVS
ncbi:uncharacterized protein PV06_04375 [Exophiala oligosperma]|uniref:Fe2OG dioxygenase domain-containing protein n=2 Tax=Chaetothyriales TaxID=34395 RepID=A0A0D2E612_9EURO|nr:uncharacterized protein PV06_04375 [Exophiala oligosperma]KAJ9622217.1 hypothetical protein H2204_011565 [Knufia peltigerae]KIW43254.1 hypothetical protein PV06_04375 [Exophiala oligosperma]